MRKIWKIIDDDAAAVSKLAAEVGISELTAKILVHRGITAAGDAEKFLNPETAQEFYDPFTMRGMDEAVDRILAAIDDGEKICVYGDYVSYETFFTQRAPSSLFYLSDAVSTGIFRTAGCRI